MNHLMRSSLTALGIVLAGFTLGCPGGTTGKPATDASGQTIKTEDGKTLSKAAADKFGEGMRLLKQHDKANDWNEASCKEVADVFKDADKKQSDGTFYRALYNAGVTYQRCRMNDDAKSIFSSLLSKRSDFHRARVQLALIQYEQDRNVENAISEMKTAIKDAEFKNEEALVHLAILQMARNSTSGDEGCENDLDCAKLNLQRALAINDGFMSAYNQLAVFYLESAKKKAGQGRGMRAAAGKKKKVDTQSLEMAALVVSQALRKNPNYAPLHNTSGLISAELGDLSTAARSFAIARKYNPKFFEAHMNYAAVNLSFRGFRQAEEAYRAALRIRPSDFEANLGLALAIRGQINDSNFDKNLKESEALLAKAKQLQPARAETYYNEAILVQEFKAREGGTKAEPALNKAKGLFSEFINKAGSNAAYAEAVKRAEERIKEIDQIIDFNRQTAAMAKQAPKSKPKPGPKPAPPKKK